MLRVTGAVICPRRSRFVLPVAGRAACALAALVLAVAFEPAASASESAQPGGKAAPRGGGFSVTIREDAGIARSAEPVKVSLPFAQGQLKTPEVCIRGPRGNKLPSQFEVLARWPDGSIRWMLARFFVDIPAKGEITLKVTRGESSAAKGNPPARGLAALDGSTIRIDTGPLKAAVGGVAADSFILTDSRGRPLMRERPRLVIYTYTDKVEEHRCLPPDSVRLEENGPLYASVFVAGPMASRNGERRGASLPGQRVFRYETRLHFWKGKSQLLAEHTFASVSGPRVTTVDGAEVNFASAQRLERCVIGGNRVNHSLPLEPAEAVRQMQNCAYWPECIPSWPGPVFVIMEDDRSYTVERGGQKVARGETAPGWLWAAGENQSVGVAVRNFWEEGPKALRVSGDGAVGVELYAHWTAKPGSPASPPKADGRLKAGGQSQVGEPRPKREPIQDWGARADANEWRQFLQHRDLTKFPREQVLAEGRKMVEKFVELTGWEGPVRRGPMRFGRTRAKTTDVFYLFGSPRKQKAETQILAARRSYLAPVVDPEYLCSTRAMSFVWSSASQSQLPQYEKGLVAAFRNWEKYATRYGFLHYGDDMCGFGYNNTEPSTPDDLEYDTIRGLLAQFARTGLPDYYRAADDCARHYADIDQNQVNGRVRFHGYTWDADYHEEPKSEDMGGHIYVQGMADHYALTGDRRSRRSFERVAEALADYGKDPEKRVLHWDERSISRPGIALCAIYDITGDPKHLAPVKPVVDTLVRYSGDVLKEMEGKEPFRTWLLYRSEMTEHIDELLVHYHNATGDRAALQTLVRSLDLLMRDNWDSERQAWKDMVDAPFSRPPGRFPGGPNAKPERTGMMFAYAARATGEMRYLAPFLDSLDDMGKGWELRWGNRIFAQSHLWSIPFVSLLPADWKARRDEVVLQEAFRATLEQSDGLLAHADGKPVEPEIHGQALWADSPWGLPARRLAGKPASSEAGKVLRTYGTSWVSYPAPADIMRFPGTVSLWVKREEAAKFPDVWPATDGEGVRDLLSITSDHDMTNSLDIMMGPHDRASPAYLWARLYDNRAWQTVALPCDWRWNDDKWHHIAVVWNRFSLTAYVDGEQVARDETATLPGGGQTRINIGWRPGNWYGQAAFHNLRLFRTALPGFRVKKLYESERPK